MLGADLLPLLARLGVGGLAVALSVRETLTGVFGALMNPPRVPDWILDSLHMPLASSLSSRQRRV